MSSHAAKMPENRRPRIHRTSVLIRFCPSFCLSVLDHDMKTALICIILVAVLLAPRLRHLPRVLRLWRRLRVLPPSDRREVYGWLNVNACCPNPTDPERIVEAALRRHTEAATDRQDKERFQTLMVCSIYESGVGYGQTGRGHLPNPCRQGSSEHYAWALGVQQGEKIMRDGQ